MRGVHLALVVALAKGLSLGVPPVASYQHSTVNDDAVSMLQISLWNSSSRGHVGADSPPAASVFEQGSDRSEKKQIHSKKKTYVSPIAGCEGIDCVKKYVTLPDASYSWSDTGHHLSGIDNSSSVHWTGYVLNMTSQSWLTEANVDFPVWWHTLVVIVPDNLETTNWSTLTVEFGINTESGMVNIWNRMPELEKTVIVIDDQTLESHHDELEMAVWKAARVATHTRSIGACLFNGLNEYETFSNDPLHYQRTQDEIKSYSWEDFMKNGADEPERIMELPVAKSVVRAMDTITAFTATMGSGEVTRFGLWGYSKYGTAVWMVGAIDPRVEAIAPAASIFDIPYDLQHVFQNRSGEALLQGVPVYTFLPQWIGTEEFSNLWKIVNHLYWLDNITVPTFMVMDTTDSWMDTGIPDISRWWPHLAEPKSLLFVEAIHDTTVTFSAPAVTAFFHAHLLGKPMPKIDYAFNQSSGHLVVQQISSHSPTSVDLHSTSTCTQKIVPVALHASPSLFESKWNVEPLTCDEKTTCMTWVANLDTDQANLDQAPSLSGSGNPILELFKPNCSRSGFISFSYNGPGEVYDSFQISTPIFFAFQ